MLSDLPLDSTPSGSPCHQAGSAEVWDDAMKVLKVTRREVLASVLTSVTT